MSRRVAHERDEECAAVGVVDGARCPACGAKWGMPCTSCGGRAYHDLTCPEIRDDDWWPLRVERWRERRMP